MLINVSLDFTATRSSHILSFSHRRKERRFSKIGNLKILKRNLKIDKTRQEDKILFDLDTMTYVHKGAPIWHEKSFTDLMADGIVSL